MVLWFVGVNDSKAMACAGDETDKYLGHLFSSRLLFTLRMLTAFV